MEIKNNKNCNEGFLYALGVLIEAESKNSLSYKHGDFIVYGTGGESFENNLKDLYNEKKHKKRKLPFMK